MTLKSVNSCIYGDSIFNSRALTDGRKTGKPRLGNRRRSRLPRLPEDPIDLPPDWVCEIVSPGHERKDTRDIPLLLQRHGVPFYWLIWPEERRLVAHRLDGDTYQVVATRDHTQSARIPPFDEIALDLGYILAGEPAAKDEGA
jgi:Uma2 family endonuclease